MTVVRTKPWYKSKLFWTGIAGLGVEAVEAVHEGLVSGTDYVNIGLSVAVIIFRYYSGRPITFSGKPSKEI
jgi:hypothetical protein